MKKPKYQIWVENSLRVGAGLLALGALFDALSNAFTLVTPMVTYMGTAIVFFSFAIIELRLKRNPVPWITKDGQKVLLTSIRHSSLRFYFLGMVLLLWLPRMLNYPKQQPALSIAVAGRVILDSKPLQEATITIVGVPGQAMTDQNGAFHLQIPAHVAADSLTIGIVYTWAYEKIRFDTTAAKKTVAALKINLTAPNTCTVAGWAVAEINGNPVAGAKITILAHRNTGTTDAQGYFRFTVRGKHFERVEATVSHPDYENTNVGLTLSEDNRIALKKRKR